MQNKAKGQQMKIPTQMESTHAE